VPFPHLSDKKNAWNNLHLLIQDEYDRAAAEGLGSIFQYIPDKKQAWKDLHRLTKNKDDKVRSAAAESLCIAFNFIPDKGKAWADLYRLIRDDSSKVRYWATASFDFAYPYIPDRKQAFSELNQLTEDWDEGVRAHAAFSIGYAFSHDPIKEQELEYLIRLTQDDHSYVRVSANYSLGKIFIQKANEELSKEDFKKKLENAISFFENASIEAALSNPACFCLPFYRSFYMLTFNKEEAEAEVKRYLSEAKSAVAGSESKGKLLEAVENLGNALKEAQMARDFNAVKSDLNAYKRYLDRACELLDTAEEKAPCASRLIRKGLPIIDERIKGIIAEIQEKAKALCGETKNTTFRDAGIELNRIGQDFSQIRDPIGLEKSVNNMQIVLSAICAKMPEEERGEACALLRQAKEEQYIEDKINLTNIVLGKISSQISAGKSMGKYIITNSQVQIAEGEGNVQIMD